MNSFINKIQNSNSIILFELLNHIKYFLDSSKLFTRKSWSSILRVSEAALAQWANGSTLIRPKNLQSLFNTIYANYNTDKFKNKINSFLDIIDKPLSSAEKKMLKNQNTIGDYMLISDLDEFSLSISKLPYLVKKELLLTVNRLAKNSIGALNSNKDNMAQVINEIRELNIELNKYNINVKKDKIELELNRELSFDPFNRTLEKLNIFQELKNKIQDNISLEDTLESTKYILPIDNHIIQLNNLDNKVSFLTQLSDQLENASIEKIEYLLKSLINQMRQNSDFGLSNGLLVSLLQVTLYKTFKELNPPIEKWINARKQFHTIYKEGYYQDVFDKENISIAFFKRIIDLSLSLNDYEFVEELIKHYKLTFQSNRNVDIYNYATFNYYTHKVNIQMHFDDQFITKNTQVNYLLTDMNFLKLRYYWNENNLSSFYFTYNKLTKFIWEKSLYPDSEYLFNSKRLGWYEELYHLDRNPKCLKEFISKSNNDLDLLEDVSWLKAASNF